MTAPDRHLRPVPQPLTASEARALTDRAKRQAAELWTTLLELHERRAYEPLGYASWTDYCRAEFDVGKSQAYRMLDAARVVAELPPGESPMGERVARELAPLRDEPDQLREAWAEAVERYGEDPTGAEVRDIVQRKRPQPQPAGNGNTGSGSETARMPSWLVRLEDLVADLRRLKDNPHAVDPGELEDAMAGVLEDLRHRRRP